MRTVVGNSEFAGRWLAQTYPGKNVAICMINQPTAALWMNQNMNASGLREKC
jgi:hypothetical protein